MLREINLIIVASVGGGGTYEFVKIIKALTQANSFLILDKAS